MEKRHIRTDSSSHAGEKSMYFMKLTVTIQHHGQTRDSYINVIIGILLLIPSFPLSFLGVM